MDFGKCTFGKSPRAALAGALVASVALLLALLAGDASAELITPQAVTPPPVTVPQAMPTAATPQAPPSAPAPTEPASGAGGAQPASTGVPQAGATGDAEDGSDLPDDALLIPLEDRLLDLGVSIDNFGSLYYDLVTLDNSVLQADGTVRDLIANLGNVQKTLQELRDDIKNGAQPTTNPPAPEDASAGQPGGGDEVSSAEPEAGGPSGDGSGGGSGGGAKAPDGDPTHALD